MSDRHERKTRGASTTEFALALLMVIPAALYAVHAGELFMVGAKAQEAEISAAWDVTAYRYHDYQVSAAAVRGVTRGRYDSVAAAVSASVDADLADLNSYANSGRVGVSLMAGKTQFVGQAVTCRRQDLRNAFHAGAFLRSDQLMPFETLDFAADPNFAAGAGQAQAVRDTLNRDHLITCRSRLQHTSLWVPRTWAPEFSNGVALNPMLLTPTTFGGLGNSLNGTKVVQPAGGSIDSPGMAMLTDDWAVDDANRVSTDEIALKQSVSANPKYYRVGERVHRLNQVYVANEQLNEDFTFLLGHRWMHGDEADTGELDAFRLGLDTAYSRMTNLQLEDPFAPKDGNRPWYLLPHQDGEKSLPSLDVVAATRRGGNYLGHPNASFNRP